MIVWLIVRNLYLVFVPDPAIELLKLREFPEMTAVKVTSAMLMDDSGTT